MINGSYDVNEGLKRVKERGLTTKNYGPKEVGGRKIDMYRWKAKFEFAPSKAA